MLCLRGLAVRRCYWHDKEDHGVTIAPDGGISDDLLDQLLVGGDARADREWARYRGASVSGSRDPAREAGRHAACGRLSRGDDIQRT
jgi:hypothetical protein